ncbi:MAG: hypothetical protein GY710_17215 [Desulfobacteraceae bacterium]|nr:hypothetical protein [Desulfobacteraceae bacterium]
MFVKEEPFDIYVLIDAASTYVFGHVLSRVVDESPLEKDVETLFTEAWESKGQWAKKLIVSEDSIAKNVFMRQAEKNGLAFETVPVSDLSPIVGLLRESFA